MSYDLNRSLVVAKTHLPPHRDDLLRRPRLIDFLYQNIDKQLILITAPAGYGKTSLLLDLADDADFPVGWYALDEFDNVPHVFLHHLVASIRVHFPDFGRQALGTLERAADSFESLQPVVSLVANEMFQLPDHLVLILDDYHVIKNETIDRLVALLIRYGGENCHLIVDSRTVPRIPDQVLLLARGKMDGLSINELKFTPPEIQALVQQNYRLAVPEERALELARVTDGWITALLLMAHQTGWEELVRGALLAPDATGRVYDYLAEQVFAKQSSDLQHFMIGSSVLDPLDPVLLDQLPGLGNSRQHLETLQAEQLFVAQLGDGDAFGYHPLFREFLKARLQSEQPAWCEQLAVSCARLYAERGQWERVVGTLLSVGRIEQAASALESAEESLSDNSHVAIMTPWLEALPPQATHLSPHLLSLRGKIHRARGELEQAVDCFDRAAKMFVEAGDWASAADKLELKGTLLRSLGRYPECMDQTAEMDRLLERVPPDQCMRLRAASLHLKGCCEYSTGDLENAERHLQSARGLYEHTDHMVSQANVATDLGIVARARGNLPAALEHYSAALNLWERSGNPGAAAGTLNSLGIIYHLQGNIQEAERVLGDALVQARQAGTHRVQAYVLSTLGDIRRDEGDYARALELYGDSLRAGQQAHDAYITHYSRMATANCYRLLGDLQRAREWLDSVEPAINPQSGIELAQANLFRALIALDDGQLEVAAPLLCESAARAHGCGETQVEALAEFHAAHALVLLGQTDQAVSHLKRTAELVDQLGYDHFLVTEARRAEMTLRFAADLPDIGPRFRQVLQGIRPVSPNLTVRVAKPSVPLVSVHLLGQERIAVNGQEVTQLRPQARDLFFFLLTRHPQGARRDQLWENFWPSVSADRADGALRITITRIRKALCPVTFVNSWYSLDLGRLWYDVREFEQALAGAERATSPSARVSRLIRGLELYCGNYGERIDGEWATVERQRLRELYLRGLLALGQAHLETGNHSAALEAFAQASTFEPLLEAAWAGGIKTFVKMGNRAAALAHYEKLKRVLDTEMGIEPSPELQTLYASLLRMTPL